MTARAQWLVVLGVVVAMALALVAATHFLGDEIFPVEVVLPEPWRPTTITTFGICFVKTSLEDVPPIRFTSSS